MNCTLCSREAKDGEPFWTLSWEKVDIAEFKAREQDGRTVYISDVCTDCMAKHNNDRPPLGLKDINKMREQGITKEQYYKEHGYLKIADVSESISITKNELQAFLEDWDDGKQNVYDAEWNGLSKRLANFMGLLTH